MNILRFAALSYLLLCCGACANDPTPPAANGDDGEFYDVKGFFEGEAQRLAKAGEMSKRVVLNRVAETKQVSPADFHSELAEFIATDINRPSWRDKYTVSMGKEGNLVTYTALDESLEIRELALELTDSGELTHFKALKENRSALNHSQKELVYDINKGYGIKSIRDPLVGAADTLLIYVTF